MSSQTRTALYFAILVIVQASLVKSEDKTYKCKGHDVTLSQKQIDTLKSCGEKIGVKSMEEMTPDKIPCFAKCAMETSGLVDGEGKPHKENIMADIDASVPKEMQDLYKSSVEKCIDEHGSKINPKETTCHSYAPIAMCVTASFTKICMG